MPGPRKMVYQILKKDLRPHVWQLVLVCVVMISIVGLEAIEPLPFRFLIDNVLGADTAGYEMYFRSPLMFGMVVVFAFFMVNILLNILDYVHGYLVKKVVRDIIFDFSKTAFSHIEHLSIGFYRTQEIGDYIYRLSNDVYALGEMIEDGILPIIDSTLFVVVTTIVLFFINVKLTILSLIALPFLAVGMYIFNERIVLVSKRSERLNSTVYSFIQEALSQLKTIQAFSQEDKESHRFNTRLKNALGVEFKLNKLDFLLSLVVGVVIAITYSVIIGYGIVAVINHEITVGLLVVFIFYLDNLTQPILSIIYAGSSFRANKVRVEHMNRFFDTSAKLHGTGEVEEIEDTNIHFKHVNIHSSTGAQILHNVTMDVEQGKMTVILGVSGSGKTSVISLLPRLIDEPDSGEILLGNHRLKEYDIHTLRDAISIVPQEGQLFNTTIRNIIAFGNKNCTDEDIRRAAHLAVADKFIEDLPGKYHFTVGENGNYLSGGQRQRLLIARAFVKPAKIYIFDEPLSSLDLQTRKEVWHNIQRVTAGKTTIIVTNVVDVINKADCIIMMNKGTVMHSSNNLDLLNKLNLYKLMIRTN